MGYIMMTLGGPERKDARNGQDEPGDFHPGQRDQDHIVFAGTARILGTVRSARL